MNIKRCTQSRNFRNDDISGLPATRVFEAVVTGLTGPAEMEIVSRYRSITSSYFFKQKDYYDRQAAW